mmetsp:Transcript_32851/g.48184  ORF Transcript_32851/g.48184 Transcript_32851/m.48184 type:complete len:118 (-) Transcript_32851:471-824(-)
MEQRYQSTTWSSFHQKHRPDRTQSPLFGNGQSSFIDAGVYERRRRKENNSCAKKVFCCLSVLVGRRKPRKGRRREEAQYGYAQTYREDTAPSGHGYDVSAPPPQRFSPLVERNFDIQ